MRLAHLLLIHAHPQQAMRLATRLYHADADIYIHLDAKADIAGFKDLAGMANVFFIKNRVSVFWGNYSMIQATLNGFEEILQANKPYSHINLLSGQDYPLKSPAVIQDFLFANADKSYIRWFAIPHEWDEPVSRLQKYNFGDLSVPGKHQLQQLANKLLPSKTLPRNLQMYGRSQWFTITPACAKYVVDYLKQDQRVRRFFLLTWASDELIFQTILLNSPLRDSLVNDHLRYIKFKRGDSRPQTLTITDAETLTGSGKFYARKFDPQTDVSVMDALDKTMGFNAGV